MVAMARASSTRRARPVGRESVGSSATSGVPTWARSRSVWLDAARRPWGSRRRWVSAAIWMFSRAVRVPKSSRRWKVRAMPSRARRAGAGLVMSSPSSRTRPRVGGWRPVITLNRVVLPAPLGPMSPCDRPGVTRRSTSCSAWSPPKRTAICSTGRAQPTEPTSLVTALGRGRGAVRPAARRARPARARQKSPSLQRRTGRSPLGLRPDGHDADADEELGEVRASTGMCAPMTGSHGDEDPARDGTR